MVEIISDILSLSNNTYYCINNGLQCHFLAYWKEFVGNKFREDVNVMNSSRIFVVDVQFSRRSTLMSGMYMLRSVYP